MDCNHTNLRDITSELPERLINRMKERTLREDALIGYLDGLYSLVRRYKPEIIVELGTFLGDSTFAFLCAIEMNKIGTIWTVDNLIESQQLAIISDININFSKWGKNIHLIESDSAEYSKSWPKDKKIDLLYIDTSHMYDLTFRELNGWVPLMKSGGIVAMDDFLPTAVHKAFFDWLQASKFIPKKIEIDFYEYTNPLHTLGLMIIN